MSYTNERAEEYGKKAREGYWKGPFRIGDPAQLTPWSEAVDSKNWIAAADFVLAVALQVPGAAQGVTYQDLYNKICQDYTDQRSKTIEQQSRADAAARERDRYRNDRDIYLKIISDILKDFGARPTESLRELVQRLSGNTRRREVSTFRGFTDAQIVAYNIDHGMRCDWCEQAPKDGYIHTSLDGVDKLYCSGMCQENDRQVTNRLRQVNSRISSLERELDHLRRSGGSQNPLKQNTGTDTKEGRR